MNRLIVADELGSCANRGFTPLYAIGGPRLGNEVGGNRRVIRQYR